MARARPLESPATSYRLPGNPGFSSTMHRPVEHPGAVRQVAVTCLTHIDASLQLRLLYAGSRWYTPRRLHRLPVASGRPYHAHSLWSARCNEALSSDSSDLGSASWLGAQLLSAHTTRTVLLHTSSVAMQPWTKRGKALSPRWLIVYADPQSSGVGIMTMRLSPARHSAGGLNMRWVDC